VPHRPVRGVPISDLTSLRLNAPLIEGKETAEPWPDAPRPEKAPRPEAMFEFSPEVARLRKKSRVLVIEIPPEEPEDEEVQVRHLAFPRLNDHVVGGEEEPRPWPEPDGARPFVPLAGTIAEALELRGIAEEDSGAAPRFRVTRERAAAASLIVHLLVLLFLVITPNYRPGVPKDLTDENDPLGIMRLWKPDPSPPPIPLQFFPAPGPKAAAPGKNPLLSDLDRQAHGGDPKLPKLAQPKALAREGIRDLEAGKGASGAAAAAPPPAARSTEAPEGPRSDQARALTALRRQNQRVWEDSGTRTPLRLPPSPLSALRPENAAPGRTGAGGSGGDATGEGGAGFEREGGFVDSGPLSFDTKGYDWGAYAADMLRKIKRNWDVPSLAHYGVKGRLVIRFFILKDGTVEAERIVASSGIPPYDNAAFQAIARSSRFRPLPADLGKDREGVTITFFYNIRPEDEPYGSGGSE